MVPGRQSDLFTWGPEGTPSAHEDPSGPMTSSESAPPAATNEENVLSVTELTARIKGLLERDGALTDLRVRGELSGVKEHSSGHWYFTLKDEDAVVGCVMWRSSASKLRFTPEDGLEVVAHGHISVYERRGQYQLYVRSLEPAGKGGLYEAFERLKRRLEAEGLFAPERKRPLPKFPRLIGVVTSPTGAAVRDMINVLGRRWPLANVLLAPAKVQGEGAAEEVATAIARLSERDDIDVLIVGRGGGSLEDLWAFNEEVVARAIAQSSVPVISAVGHETDFTIADFVADERAPTPSAAAEVAVPDRAELARSVSELGGRCAASVRGRLGQGRNAMALAAQALHARDPRRRIEQARQTIDMLTMTLTNAIITYISEGRSDLERTAGRLEALDPHAVLRRGYSITLAGKRIVQDATDLTIGDVVRTILARGAVTSRVEIVEDER